MSFKKKKSSPHRSISNGAPGFILQVLEPAINFTPLFFLFLLYVKLTSTFLAVCADLRLLSFVVFTYQSAASYWAVIWLEISIRDFHVFYFKARLHNWHQRCNLPLKCTYIKLDSSAKWIILDWKGFRFQGERETVKRVFVSSLLVPLRPSPSSLNSLPPCSLLWSDESGVQGHIIAFLTLQKLGTWRSPLPGTQAQLQTTGWPAFAFNYSTILMVVWSPRSSWILWGAGDLSCERCGKSSQQCRIVHTWRDYSVGTSLSYLHRVLMVANLRIGNIFYVPLSVLVEDNLEFFPPKIINTLSSHLM